MNEAFTAFGLEDVRLLIERYPLAYVQSVSDVAGGVLLPLVGEYDGDGSLVALIGHMGRRNPLCDALSRDGRAAILFLGPQGYISPTHAGLRDWAPTWNYIQLRVLADLAFDDALTGPALDVLTEQMEQGRLVPWSKDELGARYSRLKGAIVGFRAEVRSSSGLFKLGQDERPEVLEHILATHPHAELVEWMRRANS